MFSMGIDKKIRIRMIEKGITGAAIARNINVNRSSISNTIKGRCKSYRLRQAIASALGLKVVDLWPDNNGNAK